MKFLRGPDFTPVANMVQKELIQSGRLRQGLGALLRLIKAVPPPAGLFAPAAEPQASANVGPLSALISAGTSYIVGQSPATESHYAVTNVFGKTITQCDRDGPLVLMEKVLSTRLPLGCTTKDANCQLATRALFLPLSRMLSNPTIRNVLGLVNLAALPEDSFVELIKTFTAYFAVSHLDFTAVRATAETYLLPFITNDDLRADVQALLVVVEQITKPEVGLQLALVNTITCFESHDPDSAVYHMVYTLLADPRFQFSELLGGVDTTVDPDPDAVITDWLTQVLGFLRQDTDANAAIVGIAGVMLEERNTSRLLPMVLKMGDQGVVDDLRAIMNRDPCR